MCTKFFLAFLLLAVSLCHADVVCDGVDDDLTTGVALSSFLSATTGTLEVWYKPTGTASAGFGSADCYPGEFLLGDMSSGGATHLSISRNGNLSSTDRVCVWNDDGGFDQIVSTYSVNTWTHLVWVHTGGNLLMYKDGALVSSTASGNTIDLTAQVRMCNGAPAGTAIGEGVFARAAVYNVALSANQIEVLGKSRLQRVSPIAATALWDFSRCADGASCNTVGFVDRSGNNRTLTAAGTTGAAASAIGYPWGVE